MVQPRRVRRSERGTEEPIRSYDCVEFSGVADAVDFCQRLVPHVVPPVGRGDDGDESRAVVWFHVPCDGSATPGCCRLYLSHGALRAARRAGVRVPLIGTIARSALPMGAVLVFGQDDHEPTELKRQHEARRAGAGRISAHQVDGLEADTVLR